MKIFNQIQIQFGEYRVDPTVAESIYTLFGFEMFFALFVNFRVQFCGNINLYTGDKPNRPTRSYTI